MTKRSVDMKRYNFGISVLLYWGGFCLSAGCSDGGESTPSVGDVVNDNGNDGSDTNVSRWVDGYDDLGLVLDDSVWPTEGPTSESLVLEALTDGEIDEETAFVYRVFAAFRDPHLPESYRGYDDLARDSLIGAELSSRFLELTAANQALLQPYLIPPPYEGSWFDLRVHGDPWPQATSEKDNLDEPPPCRRRFSRLPWTSIDSDHIRVWYPDTTMFRRYLSLYQAFANALEVSAWPDLTQLMGRTPIEDAPFLPDDYECDGEDSRFDVYFAPLGYSAITSTFPHIPCAPAPAWIQVNTSASEATADLLAAHEFMHALQYTYDVAGMCNLTVKSQAWWGEATAEWAETYVYPDSSCHFSQHDLAWVYLSATDQSLHDMSEPRTSGYKAWLFALYLERELGADTIPQTWAQLATDLLAASAINSVISGWDQHFPQFALYGLNEPPVDEFSQWDNIDAQVFPVLESTLNAGASIQLPQAGIRSLAYNVYRIGVPAGIRLVEIQNTWASSGLDQIHLSGLLGNSGQLGDPKDWSSAERIMLCRDDPSQEEFDEIALVASNVSHGSPSDSFGPSEPPEVGAWDVPCYQLEGSSSYTWEYTQTVSNPYGSATTVVRRDGVAVDLVMGRVDDDPLYPLPGGTFEFRPTGGEFRWSGHVTYDINEVGEPPIHITCDIATVTADISETDGLFAIVLEGAPDISGPGYSGMGTTEVGSAAWTCDQGVPPSTVDPEHATWLATNGDYFEFGADGTLSGNVSVTETFGIGEVEWSSEWNLVPSE